MNTLRLIILLPIFLLALTAGCVTSKPHVSQQPPAYASLSADQPAGDALEAANPARPEGGQEAGSPPMPELPGREAAMQGGLVTPLRPPAGQGGRERQKVVLNFDKAEIGQVINQIASVHLKVNYVLDPALRGQISLYIEGEYTRDELLDILGRSLRANGMDMALKGDVYVVQPLKAAAGTAELAGTFGGPGQGGNPAVVVYRMRFIPAAQALKVVRPFVAPERAMIEEPMTNSLIFVEDPDRARTVIGLLKALDVDVLRETGMQIVPLKALEPREAARSMEAVMGRLGFLKQSALSADTVFIPLEHYRGVLVLSQSQEMLETAVQWLEALDVKGQDAGEQVHVYFVENGLAKEMAEILNSIYSRDREAGRGGGGGGLTQRVVAAVEGSGAAPAPESPPPSGGSAGTAGLSGPVRIIADEQNNAIVVRASQTDYERILRTIRSLDIMPRAVMIEVLIAEVTLNDDFNYGVQWFFRNGMSIGGEAGLGGIGLDVNPISGTLAATSSGFSAFWSSLDGDVGALVNLLSSKTDVNILSTPTLLAADNKEATFVVGGREPILIQQRQETTAASTPIVNTIQYEETGLILTVKPHINSGGLVRIDVKQTLRAVDEAVTEGINSPRFTERNIETSLIARDGKTVLIGGIIRQDGNTTHSGVPLLKDVPILSPLFSTRKRSARRTELLIAITPYIVKGESDPAAREFVQRLSEIRRLMEGNAPAK
jgi:general secretion pathway protein D